MRGNLLRMRETTVVERLGCVLGWAGNGTAALTGAGALFTAGIAIANVLARQPDERGLVAVGGYSPALGGMDQWRCGRFGWPECAYPINP